MKDNPSINVEIQGHTDNIGGDESNMELSLRRAEAVKTYLVNRGIEGGRPGAFVLALTPEGRAVAMGRERPLLELPGGVAPRRGRRSRKQAAAPDAPVDQELLARLKRWRTEEAARQEVPAYVVFHDRTLADIVAARPATAEQLAAIKGVGPSKLARYGPALLQLLAERP